jgi:ubiquinone/menaquinone biosynthesis C-methylase UbiE
MSQSRHDNPYLSARKQADKKTSEPNELNKLWWNELPMTYVDWGLKERSLLTAEDFSKLERDFLENNPWIKKNFDFSQFGGQRVLEIGCGAGAAACLFSKNGAHVTAIDISDHAIKIATENARTQKLSIDFLCMDAERMTFDSDSFDFVFAWGCLHHTHNPYSAFKEVNRVLKAKGRCLIMVYNKMSLRYYVKGIYWLGVKGKFFKGYSLSEVQMFFTDGYYHKHFSKSEFVSVLKEAGLVVRKISVTHMKKKMIPMIPVSPDDFLKRTYGWLLVAQSVTPFYFV